MHSPASVTISYLCYCNQPSPLQDQQMAMLAGMQVNMSYCTLKIVPQESDCQIAAAANLFEGAKANKAKWEMISPDSVSPFVEAGAPAP